MTRPDRLLVILAALVAAGGLVLLAVRPALVLVSMIVLLIAILLCGFGIFLRLSRIERSLAGVHGPDAQEWATVSKRLGHGVGSIQESTRRGVVRDVGALLTLHELVEVRGETPAHAPWVALPETVLALVGYVAGLPDDARILDIGSGLSTVWLALAADQQHRGITVTSLEHDADYAAATRAALARQGLGAAVDLRLAPLEQIDVGGTTYAWYASSSYRDLGGIRLVFVDGPPGSTGNRARYPALPLLAPNLADGALIVLDDTNRAEEKAIVESWVSEPTPSGSFVIERVLDHATVLRFAASASTGSSGA